MFSSSTMKESVFSSINLQILVKADSSSTSSTRFFRGSIFTFGCCFPFHERTQPATTRGRRIKDAVAAVSIGIVDGKILLDLCYEEDSKADVDMNFVMTGSGKFIEVQGTAESAPFTKKQMERMAEIAHQGIKELLQAQKKVIAALS